ncbi:ATP-binding protein [Cupriavidus oxalaticus]|uniref:ATP-binding protein n=1 Tax=Cupriavidus oxalaticus TaxID=96344 RepID=UPI004034AE33
MTTNDDSAGPAPADAARTAGARLLAAMSHEIRTPLYGMLGTLELLSMSELDAVQRQQVATITESSRVLLQMLDDLLDFSRIEAGQIRLDAVPFDPVALAETVARAQEPLALHKGVALDCDLQPGLPWLLGDPLRVRQVLANLLRNAIKFTAQGRVTLRMWQEPQPSADQVTLMLEVADTGPGIDGALLPHLFEPFTQGDATRAAEPGGAGLGLTVCRKLARLMGGDITADSSPGQGSRFTVALQLPVTASRPAPGAAGAGAGAAPAMPVLPQLGLRVLVVEDHPHNRLLLRGQLERLGCAVQLASDGAQGLAACTAGAFDVVLTDVQMPVMDGYALSRRLRAACNPVRIVALTANAGAGEADRCHDAGMDRCLVKPVLLQELAACLQALMPGRAQASPCVSADADAALLARSVQADFDALLAAAASGDLGLVQAHAQRMRGALAQVDAARDAAELCRELEAGAAWAVQATQDRIGELGLILDACLPGYRHSRLSP